MSMHLHHPSLSLNGKRKGKVKFRNAAEAKKARDLADSWQNLLKKYDTQPVATNRKTATKFEPLKNSYKLTTPPGREKVSIPSLNSGAAVATMAPRKVYTGTKVMGIATMHKSNAVPVFSDEEAVEISKMRRG